MIDLSREMIAYAIIGGVLLVALTIATLRRHYAKLRRRKSSVTATDTGADPSVAIGASRQPFAHADTRVR